MVPSVLIGARVRRPLACSCPPEILLPCRDSREPRRFQSIRSALCVAANCPLWRPRGALSLPSCRHARSKSSTSAVTRERLRNLACDRSVWFSLVQQATRRRRFRTVETCQRPPRAVRIPRLGQCSPPERYLARALPRGRPDSSPEGKAGHGPAWRIGRLTVEDIPPHGRIRERVTPVHQAPLLFLRKRVEPRSDMGEASRKAGVAL
jgi:hypothetical protein